MTIDEVPRELREAAEAVLSEFRAACADGEAGLAWLGDYEVLELRAARFTGTGDLEVYLPRPLLEDLGTLDLAGRRQVLDELRGVPARARHGEGSHWLLREQGRARALAQRPFV